MRAALIMAASVLMTLLTAGSLYGISRFDEEGGVILRGRDMAAIAALCLPAAGILAYVPGLHADGRSYLHVLLLLAYCMVMAYTDRLTGMVYTVFSLFLLLAEAGIMAGACLLGGSVCPDRLTVFYLLLFLGGSLLAARQGILGMGDVLVFTVLELFYCNMSTEPFLPFCVNAILAHLIFFTENLPEYLKKDRYGRSRPFTQPIALAAFLTIVLFF